MTEETQDRLLHDLKLLASLRENDKVCVRDGLLSVNRPGAASSLSRWVHGDCRLRTLAVVQNTFMDALQMVEYGLERLTGERPAGWGPRDELTGHAQRRLVARLVRSLQQACVGLTRLRATYLNDSSMAAKLDVLRERVSERLGAMEQCIQDHVAALPAQPLGSPGLPGSPEGSPVFYAQTPSPHDIGTFVVFDSFPARQLRLGDEGGAGHF